MATRSYTDAEIAALVFEHSKKLDAEIAKLKAERNELHRRHYGYPHEDERIEAVTTSPRCKDCLEVLQKNRWGVWEVCQICAHRRRARNYRKRRASRAGV